MSLIAEARRRTLFHWCGLIMMCYTRILKGWSPMGRLSKWSCSTCLQNMDLKIYVWLRILQLPLRTNFCNRKWKNWVVQNYRLFKLSYLEPHCKDYDQVVIYKGTIPWLKVSGHWMIIIILKREKYCLKRTWFEKHFDLLEISAHNMVFMMVAELSVWWSANVKCVSWFFCFLALHYISFISFLYFSYNSVSKFFYDSSIVCLVSSKMQHTIQNQCIQCTC